MMLEGTGQSEALTSSRPASDAPADAEAAVMQGEVFVARQPLFDQARQVIGYELLYRSSRENIYTHDDGETATLDTINNVMHVLGLGTVTEGRTAFVKITQGLLLNELYSVLPAANTAIELVDAAAEDPALVDACRRAREAGYRIVLDATQVEQGHPDLDAMADMVRVDFRVNGSTRRRALAASLGAARRPLIAAKVETHADFNEALALGFTYVQGYFFCEPQVLSSKALTGAEAVYMRLFNAINQPEIDLQQAETIIKSDVSLSYQLLRYINSAGVGVRYQVESIHHALRLLGQKSLRRWGTLLTMRQLSRNKPPELLLSCLVRGRFCEQVTSRGACIDSDHDLFLLGLLSCMDAVMDRAMSEVLEHLSISDALRSVLIEQQPGPMQHVLALAIGCERGDWSRVIELADDLGRSQPEVAVMYYDAIRWADEVISA